MKKLISISVLALATIALGLFLLITPASIIKILVIVFGIFAVLDGITSLFSVFKLQKNSKTYVTGLVKSLINIAIGVLVVYFAITTEGATVANWIVYLIAIDLVLSAAVNALEIYMLKQAGLNVEGLSSSIVMSIIFAAILFIFPALITSVAITIIGIILIVFGCGTAVWVVRLFKLRKAEKSADKTVDAEFSEVEVKDAEEEKTEE